MDTDQLNEEQLYFKAKYLKYKLKYVALKKQLGGAVLDKQDPEPEPLTPEQQPPALKKAGSEGNPKATVIATKVVATNTQRQTQADKMDAVARSFQADVDKAKRTVQKNEENAKKARDAVAATAADKKARGKIKAKYKADRTFMATML
jgi:hypothetical protein